MFDLFPHKLSIYRCEENSFRCCFLLMLPVSPTAVLALHHGELLRYPCAMLEALDMADVPTQGPVHGAAVRADQDAPVD